MEPRDAAKRPGRARRAGLAIALLGLASAGPPAVAAEPEKSLLATSGEALYIQHCAVCHAKTGRGDGPFAGILRVPPADLTTIAARNGGTFPDDRIAAFVDGRFVPPAHGTRQMPIWGRWLGTPIAGSTEPDEVVRGEILALIEYLKTLQRPLPKAQ